MVTFEAVHPGRRQRRGGIEIHTPKKWPQQLVIVHTKIVTPKEKASKVEIR